MVIGIIKVILHFPGLKSLKAKRQKLNSIKQNLRQRFNVSVSEVGFQEFWQKSLLGISMTANDRVFLERNFAGITEFFYGVAGCLVADSGTEFIYSKGNENYEEIPGRED